MATERPVYLNLFKIRLPTTGIVSFAHRVSGVLLFLAIPFSVYVLDRSVASVQAYEETVQLLQQPLVQLILLLLVWALVHHFLAGIRYLFLDFDIGIDKASSTLTAWSVLIAEFSVVALTIWVVWL